MARNHLKQLNAILKFYKNQENMLAKHFQSALANLAKSEQAYAELDDYQKQYHQELIQLGEEKGNHGLAWNYFSQFMANIDQMKTLQLKSIEQNKHSVSLQQKAWFARHMESRKIEILIEKQENQDHIEQDRQASKALDELLSQHYYKTID